MRANRGRVCIARFGVSLYHVVVATMNVAVVIG